MTSSPAWLQRLNHATTYAELQAAFEQLSAQADSTDNATQLASSIDEAIQRLIAERARDERELQDVQQDYQSFKDTNRGVVGWFKRHIPFSATRREELEHQGEVADQLAEILADNLVIARAQIIKEKLLPPERRRLGQRIHEWRSGWDRDRSQPTAAARLLDQLHRELEPSQAFVAELRRDIHAFAGAKFKDPADCQRRDADLAAASRELEQLNEEISAETALKKTGLKLLADQIASELSTRDPEFQRDGEQLIRLDTASSRLAEARTVLAKLVATVGQAGELIKKLQAWPDQLRQARQVLSALETERGSAAQVRAARAQVVQERELRLSDAQRAVDQAKQALASLQPALDAHRAQRAAQKSMPLTAEAEPGPVAPIIQQSEAAQRQVDQLQSQWNDIKTAVEAARREFHEAESAIKANDEKLTQEQTKLRDFEKQEPQLRRELTGLLDRGQREFAETAASLANYLHVDRATLQLPPYRPDELSGGAYGYWGPLGMERAFSQALFQSGDDFTRHLQAATSLSRLNQWQDTQSKAIENERAQARGRREAVWRRRCRELLGDLLGDEACSSGLSG